MLGGDRPVYSVGDPGDSRRFRLVTPDRYLVCTLVVGQHRLTALAYPLHHPRFDFWMRARCDVVWRFHDGHGSRDGSERSEAEGM